MPLLRTDDWTLNSSIDTNKGKYPSLSFPPVIAEDGAGGGVQVRRLRHGSPGNKNSRPGLVQGWELMSEGGTSLRSMLWIR